MGLIEGRTWLEVLSPGECWAQLADQEIGRLAVLVDGVPEIYPVNFVLDGHSVLFRTDPGASFGASCGVQPCASRSTALTKPASSGGA